MTAQELAVKTWGEVGDGRAYGDLPEDYRFKLQETAKCVLEDKAGGIEGLQDFEVKAKEIKNAPIVEESSISIAPKQGPLPEDFPGVTALQAAGISTYAQLRKAGDVTAVDGIGPATAEKIAEALNS